MYLFLKNIENSAPFLLQQTRHICAYLHCSWPSFPKACQRWWSEKVLDKERRRRSRVRSMGGENKHGEGEKERAEGGEQVRVDISKSGSNTKCR